MDTRQKTDVGSALEPPAERRNGRIMLLQGVLRRISNELSNERVVMPFLYTTLGGSVTVAGILTPVVSLSRLVSQTLGSRIIANARRRKPFLLATLTSTGLLVVLLPLVAPSLPLVALPVFFITLAATWGILNGIGALAALDMMGRLLSPARQMSVLFSITALSGVGVIATTLLSQSVEGFKLNSTAFDDHSHLVWTSAIFMGLSALVMLGLREEDAREAAPEHEPLGTYLASLAGSARAMLEEGWFRRFLRARVLFLSVEFSLPFFAVHAAQFHAETAPSLTMLVIAVSLGMITGGVVWPWLGKRRSLRFVLTVGPLVAIFAAAIAVANHVDKNLPSPEIHALAVFFLSLASQATADGSNSYVVRNSGDEERPYAVAMTNVVAGVFGLGLAMLAGLVADGPGTFVALLLMVALNIAAAFAARSLVDVSPGETAKEP